MESAIQQIGLPVKCHHCGKKGFMIPATNYGGWYRRKVSRVKSLWYCPKDFRDIKKLVQGIDEKFKTPQPVVDEAEAILSELDNLLGE